MCDVRSVWCCFFSSGYGGLAFHSADDQCVWTESELQGWAKLLHLDLNICSNEVLLSISCIYVQGDSSALRPGFCWLRFGMFPHPAWAVGSYSSSPRARGTPQIKVNPTQVLGQMNHPVQVWSTRWSLGCMILRAGFLWSWGRFHAALGTYLWPSLYLWENSCFIHQKLWMTITYPSGWFHNFALPCMYKIWLI